MKQYRVMVKSIKSGEWYWATMGIKRTYSSYADAIRGAETYMERDRSRDYQSFTEYKIMVREVGEWTDETEERCFEFGKPNVNAYWEHVKSVYPFAVFDFWYRIGELHFYPDRDAMRRGDDPYGCIMEDGKYVIYQRF